MPGGLRPPLCCQQTSGDGRVAGWAAGSQPLPGGLHICPAKGPGLGEDRSGHSPQEGREGALCSLDCLHQSRQPWDVLSHTLPCPCPPAGDSKLECLSLSDPGPRLPGQPPLAAEEASWSPSLSEWEGGEQLKGSPEGNFQKNQPASGIWPCKKCFPSPWLSERGLHVVETSLIPGACKTGVKREDWESLWLRV